MAQQRISLRILKKLLIFEIFMFLVLVIFWTSKEKFKINLLKSFSNGVIKNALQNFFTNANLLEF